MTLAPALKWVRSRSPALAELGNWIPSPDYRGAHTVRNFVGCMDDFSLYARALSDAEVRKLAE